MTKLVFRSKVNANQAQPAPQPAVSTLPPPALPYPVPTSVSGSIRHLRDARMALERCEQASNEAQVLDSINSATLFIRLAKSALEHDGDSQLVVTTDSSGRSTVKHKDKVTEAPAPKGKGK